MPKAYDSTYSTMPPTAPTEVTGALKSDLGSRVALAFKKNPSYQLETSPGRLNIVYIEGMDPDGKRNDNAPNVFNDLRILLAFEQEKPVIKGIWEATTEPGRYWTEHPMNPGGAFRIAFGQYTAWQYGEYHGAPALIQAGKITGYRDANKDYKRDGDKTDTGDYFGVHHHGGYNYPHDDLGRSSAGCLVGRTVAGHAEFMRILATDPRYKANRNFMFTATIFPAEAIPA